MKNVFTLCALLFITLTMSANVNTSRKGHLAVRQSRDMIAEAADSTGDAAQSAQFMRGAVTMKGFSKRASDAKETFLLTNHTTSHISRVVLRLRYTDVHGALLHERTVAVDCDLPARSTRQAMVKTFDTAHVFYYYLGSKPRKQATPFRVAFKLLRYDIVRTPNP